MRIIRFIETIPTSEMPPDSLVIVNHYVSEHTALRVADLYYTGCTDGKLLVETIYAKQALGEAPHNVRCPSSDVYLEATAHLRDTLEFSTYEDLTAEIQPFFRTERP